MSETIIAPNGQLFFVKWIPTNHLINGRAYAGWRCSIRHKDAPTVEIDSTPSFLLLDDARSFARRTLDYFCS